MEGAKLDILSIIWHSGFVVKIVLGLLIASSVVSWAIILKKRRLFKEVEQNNKQFQELYENAKNLKEIMIQSEVLPFSPNKTLFVNGYRELMKMKENHHDSDVNQLAKHFQLFGMGLLERGLKKGFNETNEVLAAKLSTLASIGSVTPFVGLFGTVWGIIDAFAGLAGGGGSIDAVAPGIAEALVATAVGLAAAIPAVWGFNHFNSVNEKINSEMESFGQDFINVVERSLTK